MSEATLQATIAAALAPLFHEGSVLINDYRTPQTASRQRGPWAVIAMADEVAADPGDSWSNPTLRYGVYLTLVDYRGGRDDRAMFDNFQALRQSVLTALLSAAPPVRGIEADTPVQEYFSETDEPDPDSMAQRLVVTVEETEV